MATCCWSKLARQFSQSQSSTSHFIFHCIKFLRYHNHKVEGSIHVKLWTMLHSQGWRSEPHNLCKENTRTFFDKIKDYCCHCLKTCRAHETQQSTWLNQISNQLDQKTKFCWPSPGWDFFELMSYKVKGQIKSSNETKPYLFSFSFLPNRKSDYLFLFS